MLLLPETELSLQHEIDYSVCGQGLRGWLLIGQTMSLSIMHDRIGRRSWLCRKQHSTLYLTRLMTYLLTTTSSFCRKELDAVVGNMADDSWHFLKTSPSTELINTFQSLTNRHLLWPASKQLSESINVYLSNPSRDTMSTFTMRQVWHRLINDYIDYTAMSFQLNDLKCARSADLWIL